MKDSEILVYNWLIDHYSFMGEIHRIPEESPDFVLEIKDGQKVYVEATECGWIDSLGQDTREVERKLEKIIGDEIRNLRKIGEMPEECRIGLIVDWPYNFIPTKQSVGEADGLEMSSQEIKKRIRKTVSEYVKEISHGEDALSIYAFKEKRLSLTSSSISAGFRFQKDDSDWVRVSYAEGGAGYYVAAHIVSVIGDALSRKTKEKVRGRQEYSEYWLALVDKSHMLLGDDHKPDVEEWRRNHWISSKEEIDKNPDAKYWDRIVVVSDCNGKLDYFDVINRGAY